MTNPDDQRGFIKLIGLIVIGVVVFAGYRVWQHYHNDHIYLAPADARKLPKQPAL